jgi:hypothetical protein
LDEMLESIWIVRSLLADDKKWFDGKFLKPHVFEKLARLQPVSDRTKASRRHEILELFSASSTRTKCDHIYSDAMIHVAVTSHSSSGVTSPQSVVTLHSPSEDIVVTSPQSVVTLHSPSEDIVVTSPQSVVTLHSPPEDIVVTSLQSVVTLHSPSEDIVVTSEDKRKRKTPSSAPPTTTDADTPELEAAPTTTTDADTPELEAAPTTTTTDADADAHTPELKAAPTTTTTADANITDSEAKQIIYDALDDIDFFGDQVGSSSRSNLTR